MSAIYSLDMYYLLYFFILIYLASFALPTGALIVIVSFASVASNWSDIAILIILSLTATISGDYSAYWGLRILRHKINPLVNKIAWIKNKITKVEKSFNRHSYHTVFLTRFLFPGVGPYVNYFSGLQAMPQKRFLEAVVLGEIIYCLFYIFIGYLFRGTWQTIINIVQDYMAASIFALLGLYFVFKIRKLIIKNK